MCDALSATVAQSSPSCGTVSTHPTQNIQHQQQSIQSSNNLHAWQRVPSNQVAEIHSQHNYAAGAMHDAGCGEMKYQQQSNAVCVHLRIEILITQYT